MKFTDTQSQKMNRRFGQTAKRQIFHDCVIQRRVYLAPKKVLIGMISLLAWGLQAAYSQDTINAEARYSRWQYYMPTEHGAGLILDDPYVKKSIQGELSKLPLQGEMRFDSLNSSDNQIWRDTCYLKSRFIVDTETEQGSIEMMDCLINATTNLYSHKIEYPVLLVSSYKVKPTRYGIEVSANYDPKLSISERRVVSSAPSLVIWQLQRYLRKTNPNTQELNEILEGVIRVKIGGMIVTKSVLGPIQTDDNGQEFRKLTAIGNNDWSLGYESYTIDSRFNLYNGKVQSIEISADLVELQPTKNPNMELPKLNLSGHAHLCIQIQ
jgi:hypothetical protein